MNNNNKYRTMSGASVVMFIAIVFFALWFTGQMQQRDQEMTYARFEQELKDGNVAGAIINQSRSVPTGTVTVTLNNPRSSRIVYVSDVNEVQELLKKYNVKDYQILKVQEDTMFTTVVVPVLITMAGVLLIFMLMNRQGGGGANAKAMNFGKSRARLNSPADKQVTFAEVAGLKEEKEELEEIVDFLKAPKKYIQVGARIPKLSLIHI